jgi:hypothetical protein
MELKKPVTTLIRQRRSVRNYAPSGLTSDAEIRIRKILGEHTTGPMGNRVTFHLVHKPAFEGNKMKLGTYGFIKGAQYFVAGTVRSAPFAEADYGYLLEKIILNLLDMDLGTCWLGGTFKRSGWAEALHTPSGMVIPAITPVGFPAPSMSNRERWIRRGAKSDLRKPWDEIFYDGDFDKPMAHTQTTASHTALEMVRLAPSASNKQPWRIVQAGENFHFYLSRTPGYGNSTNNIDLQHVDMGIAMSHFELTCREAGIKGNWEVMENGISLKEGTAYIVSWVQRPSAT